MRISAPLKLQGARAQRWASWQQRTKRILAARSRGRCEVTGMDGLGLDGHHLFGRSPEPWASHPLCMVAITRPCHQDLERELLPQLHEDLRWRALFELAAEFNEHAWFAMTNRVGESAMDAWRRLIPHLEERYAYDPGLNAIVTKP